MRLHYKCYNKGQINQTPLVFLHGFLGDITEWETIAAGLFDNIPCYAIDLPGHGGSPNIEIALKDHQGSCKEGFNTTIKLLHNTLNALNLCQVNLLGYSLGGRIALQYAQHYPETVKALILESSHFGFTKQAEKSSRLTSDIHWAEQFKKLPVKEVLTKWYQQAVFSSLNSQQITSLIEKRQNINRNAIAKMLIATSLAKQTFTPLAFNYQRYHCYYLYGKNDKKFQHIALQRNTEEQALYKAFPDKYTGSYFTIVPFDDSGHNVHIEQALNYSQYINSLY